MASSCCRRISSSPKEGVIEAIAIHADEDVADRGLRLRATRVAAGLGQRLLTAPPASAALPCETDHEGRPPLPRLPSERVPGRPLAGAGRRSGDASQRSSTGLAQKGRRVGRRLSIGIENGTLSGIEYGTLRAGPCGGNVATGVGSASGSRQAHLRPQFKSTAH